MVCLDGGGNSILIRGKKTSLPESVAAATGSGRECGSMTSRVYRLVTIITQAVALALHHNQKQVVL